MLTKSVCYDILLKHSKLQRFAGVAQLVEQLICNQQVGGSSPSTSSIFLLLKSVKDLNPKRVLTLIKLVSDKFLVKSGETAML